MLGWERAWLRRAELGEEKTELGESWDGQKMSWGKKVELERVELRGKPQSFPFLSHFRGPESSK
jgi:hypothetical protein